MPDRPTVPSWSHNTDRNSFFACVSVSLFAHGSGMTDMTARGRSIPFITRNSQRIIQHRGIRTAPVHYRQNLVKLALKIRGGHVFLSCQHLIRIALNGINFSVMHNKPIWMGPLPARLRIGAEPGVYQCKSRTDTAHPADP